MAQTDIMGLVAVIALLAGGYWVIKSGALQNLGAATAPAQVPTTPAVPGATPTTPVGTTPTTGTGTGDPIQDILNNIFGNANAPAPEYRWWNKCHTNARRSIHTNSRWSTR